MDGSTQMGELGGAPRLESDVAGDPSASIRILSFNVRHCRGAFSPFISEARTAKVIRDIRPDVAGLTEVYQTARRDQPGRLSRLTDLRWRFHGVRSVHGGEYGNLLLSRAPLTEVRRIPLGGRGEARGCLVAEVESGLGTLTVGVTHLGLDAKSRGDQIATLAESLPRDRPMILFGDFNCRRGELAPLLAFLKTVPSAPPTFPSVLPAAPLDRVLYSPHFTLMAVRTRFTLASDHLPLVVELTRPAGGFVRRSSRSGPSQLSAP